MLDLAAVGIEYPVSKVRTRNPGSLYNQQLIAAHAPVPVRNASYLFCIEVDLLTNAVKYDKVVSRSMHFRESELHRQRLKASAASQGLRITRTAA